MKHLFTLLFVAAGLFAQPLLAESPPDETMADQAGTTGSEAGSEEADGKESGEGDGKSPAKEEEEEEPDCE